MPEVIKALFARRSDMQKSTIFKSDEIPADAYIWPTIEKHPEPSEESDDTLTLPEEPALDLEQVEQQVQEILQQGRQQAEMEAQKITAASQIQAEKTVDEARKSAEAILQEARNNEEAVTQQAYQNGMHTAHQEAVGLLAAARDVLNAAQAWHEKVLQNSEEEVLNLTRSIAQNLFGSGTVIDEETLKQVFLKAIEDAKSLGNLRLRANPQDVAIIGEDWLEQQASLQGFSMEIVPSDGVQRGGCYIEGDYGTLDAQVDKKLERIFDKIEDVKKTPVDEDVDGEEVDPSGIISQAAQFLSLEAPVSAMEIQIAQPIDETEIIDLTDIKESVKQSDLTGAEEPAEQSDLTGAEGLAEQSGLNPETGSA